MIKQHGPVSFASPAPRRAVGTASIVLAVLSLVTAATFGADTAVLARESARDRSPVAGGRDVKATALSCTLTRFTSGHVRTVIDGRTFVFDDGREVRLAAIEVAPIAVSPPGEAQRRQSADAGASRSHAGEAARLALAALVGGREVVLKRGDPKAPPTDRYGRLVAFAFATDGTTERSLQDALLTTGHARISARIEPRGCLPGMRAHEDAARRALLGLWGDPLYSARIAERPEDILPQRGRFAVVEGAVVSVRESGGTIYVNFSRRWSEGFSAFILKRNAAQFPAAGLDLKRLKGRRVEVRGFVEQRRGPGIAVERPEQIAIIEGR